MNYKFLFQLSIKYIHAHKKMFFPFIIIVFLSSFLLTSIYVVKDSYDLYNLQINEKRFGKWDFSYSPQALSSFYPDELKFIQTNTDTIMYEDSIAYQPKTANHSIPGYSFKAVSAFDVLPIIMLEGTYPTNGNEIMINTSFMEQNKLKIGNNLTFQNEDGEIKKYTITGTYKNYANFQIPDFYTYLENKTEAFTIYANAKDKSTLLQLFNMMGENPELVLQINTFVTNTKYHLNEKFEFLYSTFTIFIYFCAFLFIFNSLHMYIKKKESYLQQLFTLGATKKQMQLSVFFEFFLVCGSCFLLSFLFSILLWKTIFMAGSDWLQTHLQLSFAFVYQLTPKHFISLILCNMLTFLLCYLTAMWKNRKHRNIKLHFRSIKLNFLPIISRLTGLEIIRTGFGKFIIISLTLCSILLQTTHIVVEYWIHDRSTYVRNDADITASFNLFNHSSKEISQFITETETACQKNNATTCSISYGILSNAIFGLDTTVPAYSINPSAYQHFLKEHPIINENTPILVYRDDSPVSYEEMKIQILSAYQEELDTIPMQYQIMQDKDFMKNYAYDNSIVLIPPSLNAQWTDTYTDTYVNVSLLIDSKNHQQITGQLKTISILNPDDIAYVNDNKESLQQFYRDSNAIRIFIYGLNFSILAICLFVIYNILTQYCMKNSREINLLITIGMTKRDIKQFFIKRAAILSLISIALAAILESIILSVLRQVLHLPISTNDFIMYLLVYSIAFLILITAISLITLNKYIFHSKDNL